jgi:putative glutamine amidotransferase
LSHSQTEPAFASTHTVDVARGSLLHRLSGAAELGVGSYHHQAVDRLGAGLAVCATASDGTVEAVWDPAARFCLGVQWHPEVLTHRSDHAPLFASLVAAACGVAPVLALAV